MSYLTQNIGCSSDSLVSPYGVSWPYPTLPQVDSSQWFPNPKPKRWLRIIKTHLVFNREPRLPDQVQPPRGKAQRLLLQNTKDTRSSLYNYLSAYLFSTFQNTKDTAETWNSQELKPRRTQRPPATTLYPSTLEPCPNLRRTQQTDSKLRTAYQKRSAIPLLIYILRDVFFTKDTPPFYEGHFERACYSFTYPYLQRFYFHEGHPKPCNPLFAITILSIFKRL